VRTLAPGIGDANEGACALAAARVNAEAILLNTFLEQHF
jgi:hypothetical protein